MSKERSIVFGAISVILLGLLMPFAVRFWYMRYDDYSGLANLGSVGDFLAGTTVTFLNTGSILLLLATIFMQRKEINISQQGIDELIKQTKSAEEQAIEARKETKITNYTMKKQQFDSTFFNMIDLHHNILKEIKYFESLGRDAIQKLSDELNNKYRNNVYINYSDKVKNDILNGDKEILDDFVKNVFINDKLRSYTTEFDNKFTPDWDDKVFASSDYTKSDDFYINLKNGTDKIWNDILEETLINYEKVKLDNSDYNKVVNQVNFHNLIHSFSYSGLLKHTLIKEFNENFYLNPLKSLKIEAYELMYKDRENIIGHYYRNLYRIVKLVQDEKFDEDSNINENEKKKYRGILRAQLSSIELQMIFYNIVYSKKGEKFRELLIGTNFFDDHLIIDELLWKNDIKELIGLSTI